MKFSGKKLKTAIIEKGITQRKFAKEMKLSNNYISIVVTNKRTPSLKLLIRFAKFLNKDMNWFFEGDKK